MPCRREQTNRTWRANHPAPPHPKTVPSLYTMCIHLLPCVQSHLTASQSAVRSSFTYHRPLETTCRTQTTRRTACCTEPAFFCTRCHQCSIISAVSPVLGTAREVPFTVSHELCIVIFALCKQHDQKRTCHMVAVGHAALSSVRHHTMRCEALQSCGWHIEPP